MEAPTDAEIIERLRMADQEAMEMGRRVGPGNWANITAMALAFYALKTEDPETVVSENLERVGLIVRHYGPTRSGWGDSPASDDASAMEGRRRPSPGSGTTSTSGQPPPACASPTRRTPSAGAGRRRNGLSPSSGSSASSWTGASACSPEHQNRRFHNPMHPAA